MKKELIFYNIILNRNPKDIQLNIELGEFYFLNENIDEAKNLVKWIINI